MGTATVSTASCGAIILQHCGSCLRRSRDGCALCWVLHYRIKSCPEGVRREGLTCRQCGNLADHSDLLQVQDLVSITHHAFDRYIRNSDCDYQRPTHSLLVGSYSGCGSISARTREMGRLRGARWGKFPKCRW